MLQHRMLEGKLVSSFVELMPQQNIIMYIHIPNKLQSIWCDLNDKISCAGVIIYFSLSLVYNLVSIREHHSDFPFFFTSQQCPVYIEK